LHTQQQEGLVKNGSLLAATAVLITGGIAGCSSGPPPAQPLKSGTLYAGTARVTVNGTELPQTEAVRCMTNGFLTAIDTGDQASGTSALITNKNELATQLMTIRDLGGFTGSYAADLQGTAETHMVGATYTISGTAEGFDTANPSFRKSGTFEVMVAC
jgi:lipoprotein LpqH